MTFGKKCPAAKIRPGNGSTMASSTFTIGPAIHLFNPYPH